MPNEINMLLLGAFIGFFATFITTIINFLLQLVRDKRDQKWKSEQEISSRWWERKAAAYGNIISGLVDLTNLYIKWHSVESKNHRGEDDNKLLRFIIDKFDETTLKIEKAEIEGAYFISEDAATALNNLILSLKYKAVDVDGGNVETLNTRLIAAKECLKFIRNEAHKNLNIKN
jgi:hypothetical protein